MNIIPIVLAGGFGTRLNPLSTKEKPKQFICFFKNNNSLFQETIIRIRKILKQENILILCNKLHIDLIKTQLKNINENKYILLIENENRNTFASVLVIISFIYWKNNFNLKNNFKIKLFISPSDSCIINHKSYKKDIIKSIKKSYKTKKHIIFGIKPNSPNTNYGYIKINDKKHKKKNIFLKLNNFFNKFFLKRQFFYVEKFIEKPNVKKAELFIKNSYLWNSGTFIFDFNILINEIKKYNLCEFNILKHLLLNKNNFNYDNNENNLINNYKNNINCNKVFFVNKHYFHQINKISIDKAIVEKSKNLICCKSTFDWCDAGSFECLNKLVDLKIFKKFS